MKDKPVILVVDDQPQNIELLEAHLVPLGYEIVVAVNGEDALEKFSANQIDLILLDIAKMENNEMAIRNEDCELENIVSSATQSMGPLIKAKAIHLSDKTNETNARVKVQRDLIERVVQNLLSNAVHYTPELGNILIESEVDERSKSVVVSVSDSGSGIPEEHRQKIFDKFSTVEAKEKRIRNSTGLGLTFCKLAVELHGGKIWVEDRNGGGSVFRFTLPIASVKHQVAIGSTSTDVATANPGCVAASLC